MAAYVSHGGTGDYQPMNANFGLVKPLEKRVRGGKRARYDALSERALKQIDTSAGALEQRFAAIPESPEQ